MNNDEAIKYRNKLPKINNFTIMELHQMPKYFGWLKHSINRINKIHMFLGGNDDGVALRCFWNNHYEKKTLEIWSKLSAIEGIILDIGAHTGIYSLAANNSIKKGQILSFEPHFLNFARLNLNLRGNGFSTRTMFMNTVGKQNQIQPFSVMNNIDYLTSGGKIGNIKNQFTTQIQTIAIDSFLDKTARNNVKLIKIDVEVRIATWNINSVRLRINHVLLFIKRSEHRYHVPSRNKNSRRIFSHQMHFLKLG
jgi:FkbM family methyltransferase